MPAGEEREQKPLVPVTESPPNAETPLERLAPVDSAHALTPADSFFVRCNFDVPVLDGDSWAVRVEGAVSTPATLALADLRALPYHEVTATVECAGNGRRLMRPAPGGTPWELGAVSTGVFGGTRLGGVLEACGVAGDAVEVVCEGADAGPVEDGAVVRFARSLPRVKALHPDTLLAWSLNGEPLAPEHGFPLRVFVPGWYGVASVKWLQRLVAVREPFTGHFQTDRYVYRGHPAYAPDAPVQEMQVRALVTSHRDGVAVRLQNGRIGVSGVAWSGFGPVTAVELSDDEGATWSPADLTPAASAWAACRWSWEWRPRRGPGMYTLMARARDASGRKQPLGPVWNELGYGNNVVHRVRLMVGQ